VRGPSKSGKSWLRQKVLGDPIVVQCRLRKSLTDIYVDALSQLGIRMIVTESRGSVFRASLSASGNVGTGLLAKIGLAGSAGVDRATTAEEKPVGHDIDDLRYVAEIIRESGRTLVVEDFHYMAADERRDFAFDLKTLWDYRVYVVIIGVWSETNLLLYLNPDLSGRVAEVAVDWSPGDLGQILLKGGSALNLEFSPEVSRRLVELAYSNAGVLQELTLRALDEAGIVEGHRVRKQSLQDTESVESAAMLYAEQLNPVYQQFAKSVSSGIRMRSNATGIYAHAMAAILAACDEDLIRGLHAKTVFAEAHKRQERIQYGNLKTVLEKLPDLQVDADGRGLILSYNAATEEISVVDRQLLLYRKYATVKWPWEDMIREADDAGGQVDLD
jgi:PAS domain-containing protein